MDLRLVDVGWLQSSCWLVLTAFVPLDLHLLWENCFHPGFVNQAFATKWLWSFNEQSILCTHIAAPGFVQTKCLPTPYGFIWQHKTCFTISDTLLAPQVAMLLLVVLEVMVVMAMATLPTEETSTPVTSVEMAE